MTTRLRDLTVNRVALVDRGADQDAHIVLFKREGDGPSATADKDSDHGVTKEENMPDLNLEGLPEGLRQHFTGAEGITQEAVDALSAGITTAVAEVPAETLTALEEVTAKRDELEAELAKLKSEGESEEDEVTKGLSPEAKALFEKQASESAELRKSLEASIEKADIRDAIEKAATDFPHLTAVDSATLGPIRYRIGKNAATPEDLAKLDEVLAAASNAAEANVLLNRELGTSAPGSVDADDELSKLAKAYQSSHEDLSPAQAYAAMLETPAGSAAYAKQANDRRSTMPGVTA